MKFRRGTGRLNARALNRIASAGERGAVRADVLDRMASSYSAAPPTPPFFLAKITGSDLISGKNNRWEYEWEQVGLVSTGDVSPPDDAYDSDEYGLAWNLCELLNDGSGVEGPGWDLNNIDSGSTFALRPIAECVVQMWVHPDDSGEPRFVFWAANVVDGECPPEEEPP
jgi:hypothetical protein